MKRLIENFRKEKQKFVRNILRADPIDLAYFYVRGATGTEKALIDEAIPMAPTEYVKKFERYTKNSHLFDINPKLRERYSGLEHKTE